MDEGQDIQCLSFPLTAASAARLRVQIARLGPVPIGSVEVREFEDLAEMMRDAAWKGRAARFHAEEFLPLVGMWRWLGIGVGLLSQYKHGQLQMAHLMVAEGPEKAHRLAATVIGEMLDSVLSPRQMTEVAVAKRPTLVTFTVGQSDAMAHLLGLIVMACFCDVCNEPQ